MEKHFIELTPQYEDVWLLQWFKIILPYLRYEVKTPVNYYQKLVIAAFKINPTIIKYMYEKKSLKRIFFLNKS